MSLETPRLITVLLIATVLTMQVSLLNHVRVLGVMPDIVLLLTILLGLQRGAETGALVGLGAGIGFDMFLNTPLGLSALVYGVTGYVVGFARDRVLPNRHGVSLAFVASASAGGSLAFAAGAYLFSAMPLLGPLRVIRIALVVTGWNVMFSRPLGWVVAKLTGVFR